jgi:L-aminopeptidase/D-esterase-like protein
VVATEAPLSRIDLRRLARMAATAMPRRVRPVHTPLDGDMVFALSTSEGEAPRAPLELLALGDAAREALEESLTRGVARPVADEGP